MKNNETARSVPIIDHVGIAVNSIEDAVPGWAALLGGPPTGEERVEAQGVRVAFFGSGHGRIELLEPLDEGSPIARHLERRGAGVHHVCLEVADLEAALRRAGDEGWSAIPPAVRSGAEGARIAFLHPRTTGGVLLELREAAASE